MTTTTSSFSSKGTRGTFRKTTREHPCPVCQHFGWCRFTGDGSRVLCERIQPGSYRTKTNKLGKEYYLHRVDGSTDPSSLPPPLPAASVEAADPDTLHGVYSALLGALPLNVGHRDNLRGRGLTEIEIDHRMYRSHIREGRAKIARALRDRFGEAVLRVPGIILKEGESSRYITIAGSLGLLIPVRDLHGRIVGIRIRRDEVADGGEKYHWLSSASRGGPGPGAHVHVPMATGRINHTKCVRLTEGELKADVATARSTTLTLSVPGVALWRLVVPVLTAIGGDTVRIAFDADASSNPAVAQALDNCAIGLIEAGFTIELETWPSQYKGVDDALAAGAAIKVVPSARSRETIGAIVLAGGGGADPPKVMQGDADEGDDEGEAVYLPEWKPFPVDALPAVIHAFAIEHSRSIECDPAITGLFSLGTVAGCIGGSRVIRIRDTWFEPCAIFGCVIGVSCCGKSAALRAAIEPAELFDLELYTKSREAFAAYDLALEQFAAWKGEKGAEKPSRPVEPNDEQIIAQDITIEDVIKRMTQNQRGLMFPFEELRMFFESMGRYKSSGGGYEQSIWINIFDGINFHFSRSKYRQRVRTKVLGSVFGGTQPKAWTEIASPMAFGTGFLGRVLPIWPDKVPKTGLYVPPSHGATQDYHELVRRAALLDRDGTNTRDWSPVQMHLTGHAQQSWNEWEKRWGDRIDAADGEIHTLLARMKTYCARLALIAAVCDSIMGFDGREHGPNIVEGHHVHQAIKLCEWFAEEGERIYFRGRMNPKDLEREQVVQKMRDRHGPKIPRNQWYSLTKRELWASNRGKWGDSTAADAFLESLTVSIDKCGEPNGKPGPVIRVGRRYFLRDKLSARHH